MGLRQLKNLSLAFLLATGAMLGAAQAQSNSPPPRPATAKGEGTALYIGQQADGHRVYSLHETLVHKSYDEAQTYCEGLKSHGYNDWKMPTREQVDLLQSVREMPTIRGLFTMRGGFLERFFWASEQDAQGNYYARDMVTGTSDYFEKKSPLTTLCMRMDPESPPRS